MAFNTNIMTSTEVKNLAVDDLAFDQTYFDNYIITSQRKYVRTVLGKDFYNEILSEIEGATLTVDNSTLLESFIKPMLAHYIVYECYSKVHTQLTNQGAMSNDTEFTDQTKSFEYSQSRDFYMNKADFWRKDMVTYIDEVKDNNSTKYPLFNECADTPQVNKKGLIFYS